MSDDFMRYETMLPGKLAAHLDGPWSSRPPGPLERAAASRIRNLANENMNLRGVLVTTEDFGRLLMALHEPLRRLVEMGPVHLEAAVRTWEAALAPGADLKEPVPRPVPPASPRAGPEEDPTVISASVTREMVALHLSDGRAVCAPLDWFPRLKNATAAQRANWQVSGAGFGVHWPGVDEDISVRALLGRPT